MVNAQEWLDTNYPKNKRSEIKELDAGYQNLEGELDLSDFTNLNLLILKSNHTSRSDNYDYGYNYSGGFNLNLITNIGSTTLYVRKEYYYHGEPTRSWGGETIHNAQKWLNKNYPRYGLSQAGQKRSEVEYLILRGGHYASGESWVGSLVLTDFKIFRALTSDNNRLTSLDLSDCVELQILNCINMPMLTNLVLPNSTKLRELNLSNNSQFKKDLMFFSRLTNLEKLTISLTDIYGSLKALRNLTSLKSLDISGTNIDSGLEYLPESLEVIAINNHDKKNWEVEKIKEQLQEYVDLRSRFCYLLNPWRENNAQLVDKIKAENNNYQKEIFNQEKKVDLISEEIEVSKQEKIVSSVATQTDLTSQQITELEELKAQIQVLVNK